MSDSAPTTSVVIRAYNEEEYLPDLLAGIAEQEYQDYEVLVVDSGSYDRTPEIAREGGARLVRIKSRDFTFGYSLNVGIEEARGSRIAIVSAHTRPVDDQWLGNLVAPLDRDEVAMVYGCQRGTDESKFAERLDFRRTFGTQREVLEPPEFFANNANSALRRELWEAHPFDEILPAQEDIAWVKHWLSRGYRVVYEPDAAIYHIHDETWPQVRHRYYREALAGKWIGVRDESDVPRVVAREAGRLVADLGRAAVRRRLPGRGREIVRFRLEKTRGTVDGLRDGASRSDPRTREQEQSLYFEDAYEAVVIEGRGQASLQTVERPQLKPGDVLVRVAYVGVCATDLEILSGRLSYYDDGPGEYPIVPGHEFSGTVVKTGQNIDDVATGDRVVAECIQGCRQCDACRRGDHVSCSDRRELGVLGLDGAYAEYVTVPGEFVHRVPRGISEPEAALAEPLAVVSKGLRRLIAAEGGSQRQGPVAVLGAGPIGHLAARVLSERGREVTAFDRDGNRRRRLSEEDGRIDTEEEIRGLDRFASVVEATGDSDVLARSLRESPTGCAVLLLGLPSDRSAISFERIVTEDKCVVGSVGSAGEDFETALRLLGELDVSALTETVLPLHQFERAWELCRVREHLKVLLRVSPAS